MRFNLASWQHRRARLCRALYLLSVLSVLSTPPLAKKSRVSLKTTGLNNASAIRLGKAIIALSVSASSQTNPIFVSPPTALQRTTATGTAAMILRQTGTTHISRYKNSSRELS